MLLLVVGGDDDDDDGDSDDDGNDEWLFDFYNFQYSKRKDRSKPYSSKSHTYGMRTRHCFSSWDSSVVVYYYTILCTLNILISCFAIDSATAATAFYFFFFSKFN